MTIFRCNIAFVLALAACSNEPVADAKICKDANVEPSHNPSAGQYDLELEAMGCVRARAFEYAKGPDRPEDVAAAAVQTCKTEIEEFQIKRRQNTKPDFSEAAGKALGEADKAFEQELRDYAKMWVVQSRVGKCYTLFGADK